MNISYCLPVIAATKKDVWRIIEQNEHDYDYIEVWLDYIEDLNTSDVIKLAEHLDTKAVFVFRRLRLEAPHMALLDRLGMLKTLTKYRCLVDLDMFQQEELNAYQNTDLVNRLILSYHNYKATPPKKTLNELVAAMKKNNPYIYKIACFCNSYSDSLTLLDLLLLLKKDELNCIILGMGKKGIITRIFGAAWGNTMNFAPYNKTHASAPGQLTKKELESIIERLNT